MKMSVGKLQFLSLLFYRPRRCILAVSTACMALVTWKSLQVL